MLKRITGLTLIELLTALAVISILLSLAVPMFSTLIVRNRITTQTNQLVSLLHFARSEAIKRNAEITICPSIANDWSAGVIAFVDHNANRQLDVGEEIIQALNKLTAQASLVWRGFRSNEYLVMLPSGLSQAMGGHFIYRMTSNDAQQTRKIIFNNDGRIRIEDIVIV